MVLKVDEWIIKEGRDLNEQLVALCLSDEMYPNFRKGEIYPICNGFVQMEKCHYIFSLPFRLKKLNPNKFMICQGKSSIHLTQRDKFMRMLAKNGI